MGSRVIYLPRVGYEKGEKGKVEWKYGREKRDGEGSMEARGEKYRKD